MAEGERLLHMQDGEDVSIDVDKRLSGLETELTTLSRDRQRRFRCEVTSCFMT